MKETIKAKDIVMEKLKLEHLAPYLSYGLKFYSEKLSSREVQIWGMTTQTNLDDVLAFQNKPILRPLSDLTKDEKYLNVLRNLFVENLIVCSKGQIYLDQETGGVQLNVIEISNIVNKLYEFHFDVFGLIEKGLAIDINTLTNEELTIKTD